MSSSAITQRSVRQTLDMTKNYQLVKAMKLSVRYAVHQCVRFTAQLRSALKALDSTQQTQKSKTRSTQGAENKGFDLRLYIKSYKRYWTGLVLSWLEPIRGSERAASRIARSVAVVIGIALSMQSTAIGVGLNPATQSLKELAAHQLPIKQEACHSKIVHRESSWRSDARNGSHHGYYQGKSKHLIGAPDDYQFYWYWSYVSNRYGIDDEVPNYCSALKHLKAKGWQ